MKFDLFMLVTMGLVMALGMLTPGWFGALAVLGAGVVFTLFLWNLLTDDEDEAAEVA